MNLGDRHVAKGATFRWKGTAHLQLLNKVFGLRVSGGARRAPRELRR